ncbi:hypothetical protein [Deinococcus peraridilitoris]|uniref:Uncharacterized protein n=1 Tax=Deinococcus peraridilitoris (strain DSM 19664 / LMG 22246 / CIP 109416 / KR-200) TaxID=937777 RepID=K9ZZK4_DEIPD|nr:hypothetical protein [Deinococcus peraridilitoris]AFZ66180.1 hypothetical protein Deipe_0590 [Deinococcus peraridilitoris DSM 19664]
MGKNDARVVDLFADALWLSRVTRNKHSIEQWYELWEILKQTPTEEQPVLIPAVEELIRKTDRRRTPRSE